MTRRPSVARAGEVSELSDALLIARWKSGDQQAAAALVERHAPALARFAASCGVRDQLEEVVQDTFVRAFGSLEGFRADSALRTWLFTILRNAFYSEQRKRMREVQDEDGSYAARLFTAPDQGHRLDVQDLRAGLAKLPPDQREALILVGAEGLSYEEVAGICGVAIGTIKSRVNRARNRLAELLGYDEEDLGTDRLIQSAMPKDA